MEKTKQHHWKQGRSPCGFGCLLDHKAAGVDGRCRQHSWRHESARSLRLQADGAVCCCVEWQAQLAVKTGRLVLVDAVPRPRPEIPPGSFLSKDWGRGPLRAAYSTTHVWTAKESVGCLLAWPRWVHEKDESRQPLTVSCVCTLHKKSASPKGRKSTAQMDLSTLMLFIFFFLISIGRLSTTGKQHIQII